MKPWCEVSRVLFPGVVGVLGAGLGERTFLNLFSKIRSNVVDRDSEFFRASGVANVESMERLFMRGVPPGDL